MFLLDIKELFAALRLFFGSIRVASSTDWLQVKSTAYKSLQTTPRNTDATQRIPVSFKIKGPV
jgi:hypothetical protein